MEVFKISCTAWYSVSNSYFNIRRPVSLTYISWLEKRADMNFERFYRILIILGLIEFFLELCTGNCREEREASIFGMMLQKHIFKTITGAAFGDVCLRECYRDIRCQSFNYVFTQNMCELSNRTKEARPEDFTSNAERYYFRRDKNRGE